MKKFVYVLCLVFVVSSCSLSEDVEPVDIDNTESTTGNQGTIEKDKPGGD